MFADIIPARRLPLRFDTLTYKIDPQLETKITPGQLVHIPFRSKEELGVVKKIFTKLEHIPPSKLKYITTIANEYPALSIEQLLFLEEIALLYRVSIGFLVKNTLFPFQKKYLKLFTEAQKNFTKTNSSFTFKTKACIHDTDEQRIVYIQKNLSSNHQQLFIVPETSSLETLVKKLQPQISGALVTITSDITNQKLFDTWLRLWQGEPIVVIGTRRAFFLPWTNIRDIFIIDEADPLHKSWDMAPRFHNRDLAKSLAILHQATLHLVGHTPSIETYYSIKKKIPLILPTFSRTDTIKLVNLKEERKAQNYEIISDQVKKNILQIDHEKNESIFLFSHHRGNSSYVACKECDQVNLCPLCFTPFTYHQKLKLLQCHECNFKKPFPAPCKICGGFEIKLSKNGTEALEEEVRKIGLKNMDVLRIDKDTDTPKIFTTNPTLIIGTQQAWRKINWNTLKLMVFMDADIPLFIPEHKSSEQLWYYLRDASFRLSKQATLVIQTAQPKQAVFNEISNPQNYYEQELANRKDFGYPPFSYLVKVYTGCLSKQEISAEAQKIYQKLAVLTKKTFLSTIVSSPRPSIPEIHQKKYWQVISIKIPPFSYKKTLQKLLEVVPATWKIDLNPQNILRF